MKKITDFSLSEVAEMLGQSHAWIKKVEKYFEFPQWGSGQRGKRSTYNLEQVELFRNIFFLRTLDFNLDQIKWLYEREKQIMKLLERHFGLPEDSKGAEVKYAVFYLITNVFCGCDGVPYDVAKFQANKEAADNVKNLYNEYADFIKCVIERINIFSKRLNEEKSVLISIVGSK